MYASLPKARVKMVDVVNGEIENIICAVKVKVVWVVLEIVKDTLDGAIIVGWMQWLEANVLQCHILILYPRC